jgi:nitrate reductase gamma subunit
MPAGAATLLGIGLLIYWRRTTGAVRLGATRNDTLMYVVLTCALVAGMCCTLAGATHFGEPHDYR